MIPPNVIDVSNLTKTFNNHVVVDGISLRVKKGEVFGFLGPNGSGKTTTLRMLCGLLTPNAGEGTCLGFNILSESEKIMARVGYMTQRFSFYEDLSVLENLNFVARVYQVNDRKIRVKHMLEYFELTDFKNQLAGNLSGGWKQRMALAACILHKPDLLLLDEPTAGIDPVARRDFWDKIHALSNEGITTLMTTHNMDEAERCIRLAYISDSRLIVTGTVDEVIQSTGLKTWEIRGDITTLLLQRIKEIDGVMQAALFGRKIHVCGYKADAIENGIKTLSHDYSIQWTEIETTLEDAFLRLIKKDKDKHG